MMIDPISSTQIVSDIVNKAGIPVDATIICKRLGLGRVAATKCLNRAFKAGLIKRSKKGWYVPKESK